MRRRPRRVSSGRAAAWSEALVILTSRKRMLVEGVAICGFAALVINLPWLPGLPWMRGFATALVLTTVVWIITWVTWVSSGLAFRIQGAMAEDWTAQLLREHESVLEFIPSLNFDREDIDHVAITRSKIVALETKWCSAELSLRAMDDAVVQADRVAHHLRMQLTRSTSREEIGGVPVEAMVIWWGPRIDAELDRTLAGSHGPVRIVGHSTAVDALRDGGPALIGSDFAGDLAGRLNQIAYNRDRQTLRQGPLLRWLARAR